MDAEEEFRRAGSTLCASLRSRNAHGHLTRAILCENLQEKRRTPIPGTSFCASLRSRNAHGHPGQAFCASLRSRNAHGHFRRAILCGKFTGEMPDAPDTTSIKHRALNVWGNTIENDRKHTIENDRKRTSM